MRALKILAIIIVLTVTASGIANLSVLAPCNNAGNDNLPSHALTGNARNDTNVGSASFAAQMQEQVDYLVPIIFNITSESSHTSYSYQQLIEINRTYFPEINSDFSNIFFSYANGSIIPAWIQNVSNESALTWLNLSNSSSIIYIDIVGENISLFNSTGFLGYGLKYFNAPYIFPYATDFSGNSLPAWLNVTVKNGSYRLGQGITFSTNSSNGIWSYAYTKTFYQPIGIIADVASYNNSKGPFPMIGIANPIIGNDGYGLNTAAIGTGNFGTSSSNYNRSVRLTTGVNGLFWLNNSLKVYQNGKFYPVDLPLGLNQPIRGSYYSDFGDGFSEKNLTSVYGYVLIASPPVNNTMPSYKLGEIMKAYNVSFRENGVEEGKPWFVNLSGNVSQSSGPLYGAHYSFYLPNGSYTYSITSSSYFTDTNAGMINVNGASVNIYVIFQKYANIKGVMTPWSSSAAIGGNKISYSGWVYNKSGFLVSGTFNVTLKPGNYTVLIEDNGYRTFHENISLSSGELLFLNVTLPPLKSNIISPIVLSSFVVAAVAIALIALILYMRHRRRKR